MCIYCIHIFTGGKPVWENTNHRSTITSQTQQKVEEDDDEDDVRFRYKLEQVDESEFVERIKRFERIIKIHFAYCDGIINHSRIIG